jgi:hypothetical protein
MALGLPGKSIDPTILLLAGSIFGQPTDKMQYQEFQPPSL